MSRYELRAYSARVGGKMGDSLPFVLSTDQVARDGLRIDPKGWELDNYIKSGAPLLVNHDYMSLPIGTVRNLKITDNALLGEALFDQGDEKAVAVERKYRADPPMMTGFSVGWRTIEQQGDLITRSELIDASAVAIPSDVGAVALARSLYQRSLSTSRLLDWSKVSELSESEKEALVIAIHRQLVDLEIEHVIKEELQKWARAR